MADDTKSKTGNRRSLLEENFRQKRIMGLQTLRRFGIVFLLISFVAIGFGVWNIVLAVMDDREWPFVIPIGCIAGVLGMITSAIVLHLALTGLRFETPGDKTRSTVLASHKNKILIVFVSAVYNFVLLLLCCAGSVLGIVLCVDDHANCEAYHDSKMAISIAVAALSIILWLSSFVYTRWYFVYSRAFGFKSRAERQIKAHQTMELQKQQNQTQANNHTNGQPNGQADVKNES